MRTVRLRTLCYALAAASVLATATAAADSAPTIRATLYRDAGAGTNLLRFSGEVPTREPVTR
jgi:hypothetical protein